MCYTVEIIDMYNSKIYSIFEWDGIDHINANMASIVKSELLFWTFHERRPFLAYRVKEDKTKTLLFNTIYSEENNVFPEYVKMFAWGGNATQKAQRMYLRTNYYC